MDSLEILKFTDKRKKLFWKKVEKTPTCWIWNGGVDKDGYGKVNLSQQNKRLHLRAHRISYYVATGKIPKGLICHTCDNPPCVNPAHLFDGTVLNNASDMIAKGRANRANGEKLSDLTEEQIVDIRRRVSEGETQYKVGAEYGLSKQGVSHIVNRNTWKHI